MASLNNMFKNMTETVLSGASDELLIINPDTRQIEIPGNELVFGVEGDVNGERKYFACPRIVGNNIDLATCFVRVNYRNANGEIDFDLIDDLTVSGDNVLFSWEVSGKAVAYKGQVKFNISFDRPGKDSVSWHTTMATGISLEGQIPDTEAAVAASQDGIAQLLAKVDEQIGWVEAAGEDQIIAVEQAASDAEAASVAEIEAKGVNTLNSIPDDYTALSGAVDVLSRSVAPGIVCEAEGSAITLDDASNMAMQGMRIFGRSTQDGVPTPDAPVEIKSVEKPVVTVAGKNLFPSRIVGSFSRNGVTYTHNENGSIVISGEASGGTSYSDWIFGSERPENTEVRISFDDSAIAFANPENYVEGVRITLFFEDLSTINLASSPKTIPAGSVMIGARIRVTDGTAVSQMVFYPQIEFGSVATEYEPYSAQTLPTTHTLPGIPVTSGGNYTDSDGQQWICDEVDLERGVYVRRIGEIKSYAGEAILGAFMSTTGALTEGARVLSALTTPIETPLSETEIAAWRSLHTNKPNTTILNDAGAHMVVEYVADTNLYIDKKIAALTA